MVWARTFVIFFLPAGVLPALLFFEFEDERNRWAIIVVFAGAPRLAVAAGHLVFVVVPLAIVVVVVVVVVPGRSLDPLAVGG
jgi:hypothetical protein